MNQNPATGFARDVTRRTTLAGMAWAVPAVAVAAAAPAFATSAPTPGGPRPSVDLRDGQAGTPTYETEIYGGEAFVDLSFAAGAAPVLALGAPAGLSGPARLVLELAMIPTDPATPAADLDVVHKAASTDPNWQIDAAGVTHPYAGYSVGRTLRFVAEPGSPLPAEYAFPAGEFGSWASGVSGILEFTATLTVDGTDSAPVSWAYSAQAPSA